LSNRCL
jgi:hypothetical protein